MCRNLLTREKQNLVILDSGTDVGYEVLQDRHQDEVGGRERGEMGIEYGFLRAPDEVKTAAGKETRRDGPIEIAVDIGGTDEEV